MVFYSQSTDNKSNAEFLKIKYEIYEKFYKKANKNKTQQINGQTKSTKLGKIIRIDLEQSLYILQMFE